MHQQTVPPPAWKDWDAAAWGRALLRHYFVDKDARPVSRLAVSPEELATAAGASESEAAAVRAAFLRAMRCSPKVFRRFLSSASLEPTSWNRLEPPPFIPYLFLTCFAAASLDVDTADVGQFRERVRQLLGHPVGTTYALHDLSRLWEAFAAWLQDRHDAGEPYRTLRLPDRGHMTLIGYSVRLAFPRREDRLRLREVLVSSGAAPTPTVPEAFQAIGRARNRFSSDFRHVFDRARDALASGRDVPELHALWSAILEAAPLSVRRSGRTARIRYQLLAQEDDLGRIDPFVVTSGAPSGPLRGGVQFSRLLEPFDAYDHLVCGADGNPGSLTKLLLMDALRERVPGLSSSPIHRVVREGVLLFERVDSATWGLALTRPTEGRIRALVRDDLVAAFLRLLVGSRHNARETRFERWREVADFDVTELAVPRGATGARLLAIRCLQAVEIGPHVHVMGGIPVDGGFLGIRGLLPEVHCTDAEGVVVLRVADASRELRSTLITTLDPDGERPHVFRWPTGHEDLDGPCILAGTRKGHSVASRQVVFHSRGLTHAYPGPTDAAQWLVEASTTDVAPLTKASDVFFANEASGAAPSPPLVTALAEGATVLTDASVDDNPDHDRLVEALAAISVARRGIGEAELIDVFGKVVHDASGFAVWGIIRGWVEAGYLDCLIRRQWRGRVYFARRPRLVLIPEQDGRSLRVVLHGLAPYRLRTIARKEFARGGTTPVSAASLSSFVPAPLSWRFESSEHAKAVTEQIGELEIMTLSQVERLAGDVNAAVSDEAPLPPGYELQRTWDWEAGGFRRPSRSSTGDDVRIEYYTRINGPDRYVVAVGDRRRATLSRTWALLDGFRRSGRKAFSSVGSVVIIRSGDDGPQVPLPIARAIALRSGIVGGPADSVPLGRFYAYAAPLAREQRWLLAWLHGMKADENVARRFAWMMAAASESKGDTVPVPTDLRRRLRTLESLPDAVSMGDRRIPRHLLAHLRRAVRLAEN